ncbi:hypothetical protein NP493_5897g00000 [Ridgeia piscesae]|uniref:Flavin-containing monooxygenase n=1 Tax=Ridgeia piscesae TaxID=27915 RepID=A0AAD9IT44_RIDPI|nr:hypothetical protein NP493_5897g00000 [Ridgeia piscesae]
MPLRVAVIGAGAAGLCALRHLTARPSAFTALGFEQTSNVGGTWVYTEDTGLDRNGLPIHSSVYKNMTTNLPVEVMAFPDFPFNEDLPSFVKHTDVCQYLTDYTDHFHLRDHIKVGKTMYQLTALGVREKQSCHGVDDCVKYTVNIAHVGSMRDLIYDTCENLT